MQVQEGVWQEHSWTDPQRGLCQEVHWEGLTVAVRTVAGGLMRKARSYGQGDWETGGEEEEGRSFSKAHSPGAALVGAGEG